MPIRIRDFSLYTHLLRTRFPFRYGIASMTQVPHLMCRLEVEIDGKAQLGVSADNLVPKWFIKDPDTSIEQDIKQMVRVVKSACERAKQLGECSSVFELWHQMHETGAQQQTPPLLHGLGSSLIERAVIDAFCRAGQITFAQAVRENHLGLELGRLYPELAGAQPRNLLPERPRDKLIVRHTVGLTDPLSDDDISEDQCLHDGLPQTLEHCITTYGLTHFKIKLAGDVQRDLERLRAIADLLDRACPNYAYSLDANENYCQVQPLRRLWEAIARDPRLARFVSRLLFVEQPLHRDVALAPDATRELLAWPDRPDLIIDESGGTIESLTDALAGGYVGASHKNCKGVIKGIAAACLVRKRVNDNPAARLIISAEDLSNTGPVALLQDLAVICTLGIDHAERNGHHYFRGLSAWPQAVQAELLAHHPDLFRSHQDGFATLAVSDGCIQTRSAIVSPFGERFYFEPATFPSASD